MLNNKDEEEFYVIQHVNSDEFITEFHGMFTNVSEVKNALRFSSYDLARAALEGLRLKAGKESRGFTNGNFWFNLATGLTIVQKVRVIYSLEDPK